jgi:hypothetical protein
MCDDGVCEALTCTQVTRDKNTATPQRDVECLINRKRNMNEGNSIAPAEFGGDASVVRVGVIFQRVWCALLMYGKRSNVYGTVEYSRHYTLP